ncbi:unnamed protein product [Phytophthora lilii]|uniref:Unnamed protein product n=1 Tax=Phytophthora lilii TaxID=2077276 RepID=A0A9W6U6K0_9STRA|nr:unnamed protein product [Phytophthora lilii]
MKCRRVNQRHAHVMLLADVTASMASTAVVLSTSFDVQESPDQQSAKEQYMRLFQVDHVVDQLLLVDGGVEHALLLSS